MAKKLKLDKEKLKQFLLEKVEMVGIAGAGFIALLLLVVGLMAAFGAGSPDRAIRTDNEALKNKLASDEVASAEPDPKDDAKSRRATLREWPFTPLNAYPTADWYDGGAAGDPKKRNPPARPIEVVGPDGKEKYTQVTRWSGGVFVYDVEVRSDKIWAMLKLEEKGLQTVPMPAEKVRTEHLAVVEMLFPYREQVKDYLKALRVDRVEELIAQGLTPIFDGLNVYRGEVLPDGKVDWKPVYVHEKDGKLTVSPAVVRLLKDSVYDLTRIEQYSQYLPPNGGDTPFPKPLHEVYAALKLDGITLKEPEAPAEVAGGQTPPGPMQPGAGIQLPGSAGAMKGGKGPPMMPGGKSSGSEVPQAQLVQVALKKYPKQFKDRVTGKAINFFNVYGVFPEVSKDDPKQGYPYLPGNLSPMNGMPGSAGKGMVPPGMGRPPMMPMPPGTKPGSEGADKSADAIEGLPEKVVLRFVDAGLEPGKTYQYYVQVQLKNPNLGKTKEVAFPAMADQKVLLSPFVLTPPVTVPLDYAFYFVNQFPLATKLKGKGTINTQLAIPQDRIPVQIHQLTDDSSPLSDPSRNQKVGDWVIAERLFVGRGDLIARSGLDLEVPFWDPATNAFAMGELIRLGKGKTARTVHKNALPVDLGDESSPVLADFWGGRPDEGNIEVLLMTGDGKLIVHNSHDDSDPESESGRERLRRYEAWRSRLESVRRAASGAPAVGPGGINLPGAKGPPR